MENESLIDTTERLLPAKTVENTIFEQINKASEATYNTVITNNQNSSIVHSDEQVARTAENAKFDKASEIALLIAQDLIGGNLNTIINAPEYNIKDIAMNIAMNMRAKIGSLSENIIDDNSSPVDVVWASIIEQSKPDSDKVTEDIAKGLVADLDINQVKETVKNAPNETEAMAAVIKLIASDIVSRKYAKDSSDKLKQTGFYSSFK